MTINIMMHCRDGLVLACDTLGSLEQVMLQPGTGTQIINGTGKPLMHPTKNEPIIDPSTMEQRRVIINSFGFENKIFQLKDYPVGVLINGIASIGKETVEDLLDEFSFDLPRHEDIKDTFSLEEILHKLKEYLYDAYKSQFLSLPGTSIGPALNLIVGGYSSKNVHGEIWSLAFPANTIKRENSTESPFSITCGGQPDAIIRFINGLEPSTVEAIMRSLQDAISKLIKTALISSGNHILAELHKRGIKTPPLSTLGPPPPVQMQVQLPLNIAQYQIPFNLMSLQDAVDFATFLGYITFGRQRFVIGIPTVGGAFKIAVVTRKGGYRLLTEEKIQLRTFQL
jgi:hypothetical protein